MRLLHWIFLLLILGCGVETPLSNSGLAGRWELDNGAFIDFAEQTNEATARGGAFGFRLPLTGIYWSGASLAAFHFSGAQDGNQVWFFKIQRRSEFLMLQEIDSAAIERLFGITNEDDMSSQEVKDVFDLLENEAIPTVSVNQLTFEYQRVD